MKRLALLGTVLCAMIGWQSANAYGEPVVVATGVIYPGQPVGPGMVKLINTRKPIRYRGEIIRDPSVIMGQIATRTIVPGRPIIPGYLREAYVVEAGKPTKVVYSQEGLSISMTAMALQNGGVGDVVQLRNPSSGRKIMAKVLENRTLKVMN